MARSGSRVGSGLTRSVRARVLRLVPDTGMVDDLVDAIAAAQGRPIRLLPFELAANSPTGLWIATNEADYLVYPANASAVERTAIVCHELSHIVLQHQPAGVDEPDLLAALVAPNVDPAVARRFLTRHGYAEDVEAEAETLATMLVTRLARRADRHAVSRDAISDRLR